MNLDGLGLLSPLGLFDQPLCQASQPRTSGHLLVEGGDHPLCIVWFAHLDLLVAESRVGAESDWIRSRSLALRARFGLPFSEG